MGTPHHISGSASQLFYQNKTSAEYTALFDIAKSLPHPQRTLLSSFIQKATDKEVAARFFLDTVSRQYYASIFEFLATWISLLEKGTLLISYWNVAKARHQCVPPFAKMLSNL